MYEFKSSVDKNIVNDMTSNWQTACVKLQADISGEPNLTQERRILDIITKNIYHKRPSKLPFTFVEVSLCYSKVSLLQCAPIKFYNNFMYIVAAHANIVNN